MPKRRMNPVTGQPELTPHVSLTVLCETPIFLNVLGPARLRRPACLDSLDYKDSPEKVSSILLYSPLFSFILLYSPFCPRRLALMESRSLESPWSAPTRAGASTLRH
jgi:hypothetical protein